MKIRLHIFFILCLVGLLSCIRENSTRQVEFVEVGDTVPAFSVLDSGGEEENFTASDFLGKKTLIVFFVTTCPDCQREMPKVQAAWDVLENEGLNIITISRGEDAQTVSGYWTAAGFTMPWHTDPDRSAYSKFATSTVPRVYLVDKTGVVVWKAVENLELLGINDGNDLIIKINEFK